MSVALAATQPAAAEPRQPLYYQDPTGKADFSPAPKKDAAGRDYTPVYEEAPPVPAPPPQQRGRILYYRNPMGLPDTSPVPKKDSMGMDYVPVYEDAANTPAGTVTVSPDRVQMLGVRTETAALRTLLRTIRAVGTLAADERRITLVAPRFEGWIETLLVNTTGAPVERGQTLFQFYSPDLMQAQQDYLIARGAGGLAEASLLRLRNLGVAAEDIARLRRTGAVSRTLSVTAPASGVVIEKAALAGMFFRAGDTLFRIVDLSNIWLLADVFEQDLALAQVGADVKATLRAYPDRAFTGRITFVYPTINPATRTARVRIEIANPDLTLKPDMYATAEIAARLAAGPLVTVPSSAVLDSGTRQVVLVERAPGRYEPRAVTLGQRDDNHVEIRDGIVVGETVVVGANFLIDAESNLRAALQAFTAPAEAKP